MRHLSIQTIGARLLSCLALVITLVTWCMARPQPAAASPVTLTISDATACELDPPSTLSAASPLLEPPVLVSATDTSLPLGGMELLPIAMAMTALAKDRDTPRRDGRVNKFPLDAGVKIYAGALVALDAGYAVPGDEATGLIAVGRANHQADNTGGSAGDEWVEVERGVFLFANDGSITQADVGSTAYIVDDQTVSADDGNTGDGATRSPAGMILGVEAGGVWVEI